MDNTQTPQRRKYYRLTYRCKDAQPTIEMFGHTYRIAEISEKGLRVMMGGTEIAVGRQMHGVLKLKSASPIMVSGRVKRITHNGVIFTLNKGLTFKEMVEEQRFLRSHFPSSLPKKRRPEE